MALPLFVASHRFDPRSIPGLESWWDAADAASVTLDSGRVSQLADKSGKGRHAANSTSGSTQPSYITAGRNGLNVARFAVASVQRLTVASSTAAYKFLHDGTDSFIVAVSSYGTVSDPNAVYALLGNNAGATGNVGFFVAYEDRASAAGSDALRVDISAGTPLQSVANGLNAGNTAVLSGTNNLVPAQAFVVQEIAIDANNATASQRVRIRANGGAEVAENNKSLDPSTANAAFNLQLGAIGNNVTPLQGDICEVMIFSQIPTAAARDLIRRYLGQKWGVTVA
jgi:hypothetical protein